MKYVHANTKGVIETGIVYNGPQVISYEVAESFFDYEIEAFRAYVIFDDKSRNIKGKVEVIDFDGIEMSKRSLQDVVLFEYKSGNYASV